MAIPESRVFVAEELSSSAEQLLRQKPVQSSISPCTLLGGDSKHMSSCTLVTCLLTILFL